MIERSALWPTTLRLNLRCGWFVRVVAASIGIGFLVAPSSAQEGVDSISEWTRLRQDLRPIEQEALRDPAVRELRSQMDAQLRNAIANDREYRDRQELYLSIEVRALAARQRGDEEEVARIAVSLPQVERDFWEAHSRIEKLPDVAPSVAAYRQGLRTKMLELRPDRGTDISRLFTLWDEEQHPSRVSRPVAP